MDWNYCKNNFIKKVEVDKPKIKSIFEVSNKRLKYLQEIKVSSDNVSFIVEGYYEVIKEICSAILLFDGMKSSNHQCLFSYFYKKFPEYEVEARFILRLNFLRNRLNYYGQIVEYVWYDDNLEQINKVIELLSCILRKKLN